MPIEEIDRSQFWLLARQDKNGEYADDSLREMSEKIVSLGLTFKYIVLHTSIYQGSSSDYHQCELIHAFLSASCTWVGGVF